MKVCLSCNERFESQEWTCPRCGGEPLGREPYLFAPYDDDIGDSFPADAAHSLELFEAGSFWFRSRNELLLWALRTFFPWAESFCEIGCGTGFVLSAVHDAFPRMRLAGGELDAAGLEVARRRLPGISVDRIDARRMPFDAEFDVMGAFDVIEHVDEDVLVLREMERAVKPGGGVLVTVPQHPRLWSVSDEIAHHRRRYTRTELVTKLRGAGLDVVRVTSFVTLLLPALFLRRRRTHTPDRARQECALAPGLDRWLERTMSVERALIRAGVSLPAGGSLLAVAGKPR